MCSIGGCAEANESIKCVVAKPKNILKRSCTECVYSSFDFLTPTWIFSMHTSSGCPGKHIKN